MGDPRILQRSIAALLLRCLLAAFFSEKDIYWKVCRAIQI